MNNESLVDDAIADVPVLPEEKKPKQEKGTGLRRVVYTDDFPFLPDYEIGNIPVMRIEGVKYKNEKGTYSFAHYPWYADKDGVERRASRTRPRVKINPFLRDHLRPVVKEKSINLTVEQMYTVISCLRSHGWGVPVGIAEGIDGSVASYISANTVRLSIPLAAGGSLIFTLRIPETFIFEVMEHDYVDAK